MGEVKLARVEVVECIEQAVGGGRRSHGTFTGPDAQREAAERYAQVVRQQPLLAATPGALAIVGRLVETVEPLATAST